MTGAGPIGPDTPGPGGNALLRFYRLEGPDAHGRTLPEIWAWDAVRLEGVHDYIQWLFPLAEPSAFNPQAPILTPETVAAFRADVQLRKRLLRSLTLMLEFYGLTEATRRDGGVEIRKGANFLVQSRNWLRAGDHNHLRLTRILTSLRLLGLEDRSRALLACLEGVATEHPHAISPTTLTYWRRAASSGPGAP
jgi:Opioid growth factor receptor (OGFr) conserved region